MFVVFKLQPLRVIFTQQMIMIPSLLPNRLKIQEKAQISYRKIQKLHFSLCICMSVHAQSLQSCPALCDTMDRARQAALFMGFSRQEYWSGLPCPPPRNLHASPARQVDFLPLSQPLRKSVSSCSMSCNSNSLYMYYTSEQLIPGARFSERMKN